MRVLPAVFSDFQSAARASQFHSPHTSPSTQHSHFLAVCSAASGRTLHLIPLQVRTLCTSSTRATSLHYTVAHTWRTSVAAPSASTETHADSDLSPCLSLLPLQLFHPLLAPFATVSQHTCRCGRRCYCCGRAQRRHCRFRHRHNKTTIAQRRLRRLRNHHLRLLGNQHALLAV